MRIRTGFSGSLMIKFFQSRNSKICMDRFPGCCPMGFSFYFTSALRKGTGTLEVSQQIKALEHMLVLEQAEAHIPLIRTNWEIKSFLSGVPFETLLKGRIGRDFACATE